MREKVRKMVTRMERKWVETTIEMDTVNWRGDSIHLKDVKALKNKKTSAVRIYPDEIAQAEVRNIAEKYGLLPRDVGALLMILAKPGNFQEGDLFFKYHLQKMLFYFWKELADNYESNELFPRDNFIAAENGPVPEHMDDDLKRFEKEDLITTRYEKWDNGKSKRILLTEKGTSLAKDLWFDLPDPYKEVTLKVKERLFLMSPERIRHLVHEQYPEYRDTYIKNDIE